MTDQDSEKKSEPMPVARLRADGIPGQHHFDAWTESTSPLLPPRKPHSAGWSCSQDVMTTEWNSGTPSSNEVVRQTSLTLRQSYIDVDFSPKTISPLPSACDGFSFTQAELSGAVS